MPSLSKPILARGFPIHVPVPWPSLLLLAVELSLTHLPFLFPLGFFVGVLFVSHTLLVNQTLFSRIPSETLGLIVNLIWIFVNVYYRLEIRAIYFHYLSLIITLIYPSPLIIFP